MPSRQTDRAHALHEREEVLLLREGHLDVELRDLLDPVGAQVLVAEADRDLVVAVEAADHEQLLEDLRRLRQREEAALLQAARHDEVARALGRRLEEDRRLDVEEAVRLHLPADRRDQARAEPDVPLHPRPAQVEPPVAEAQRLVDPLLVELERQRRRAREDLEPVDLELDVTGRQVGVDVLRRASDDLALRAEDELVADLVRGLGRLRRPLGVDDELADPARRRAGRRRRGRRGRAACRPSRPASGADLRRSGPISSQRVTPFPRSRHASGTSCAPRVRFRRSAQKRVDRPEVPQHRGGDFGQRDDSPTSCPAHAGRRCRR